MYTAKRNKYLQRLHPVQCDQSSCDAWSERVSMSGKEPTRHCEGSNRQCYSQPNIYQTKKASEISFDPTT